MNKYLIGILLLGLAGCASTRMSVYKDPEFLNAKYHSLVVNVNLQNYKDKTYFEEQVCKKLLKYDVECTKGIDIFLPTRKYTNKERAEQLSKINAEGLLTIQLIDSYATQSYIPPITSTSRSATSYGNVSPYNQTTNTYGGYVVSKPVEDYEVSLIDVLSGNTAFVATSTTKGSAFADSPAMTDSLSSEVVRQLRKVGLVGNDNENNKCRKGLGTQKSSIKYTNPAGSFCNY